MLEVTRSTCRDSPARFRSGNARGRAESPARGDARRLLLWVLLFASLALYCAGRFLNTPQPRAATVAPAGPQCRTPFPVPTPNPLPDAVTLTPAAPSPPLAQPAPQASSTAETSATSPEGASALPGEPDAGAPSAVLARQLDGQRTAESRWPALLGVRFDEGSTPTLGRFQFGYGRWLAEPPAGLNARNGTALEEPGCLYVKLRIRF